MNIGTGNWGRARAGTRSVLLACLATLGFIALGGDAHAITFGEYDGEDHPSAGGLMVPWGFPACSGVLIHKDAGEEGIGLFLTAGHCTARMQELVDLGVFTINEGPADLTVNFHENPDFEGTHYTITALHTRLIQPADEIEQWDDQGVVVFAFDASTAGDLPEPATMAPVGFLDNFHQRELRASEFILVGYGATLLWPHPRVQYEDLRQRAWPEYRNLVYHMVKMQQNGMAGNGGGCSGDSGGPLLWVDPVTGAELLVGTASGGSGNCNATGLFYRVDEQTQQDFIQGVLDGLD
jgi:hypothetical protein